MDINLVGVACANQAEKQYHLLLHSDVAQELWTVEFHLLKLSGLCLVQWLICWHGGRENLQGITMIIGRHIPYVL